MLKPEDCKPGVEVICIDASFTNPFVALSYTPWLKIGMMYTIRELVLWPTGKYMLRLGEIEGPVSELGEHGFYLSRFKLLRSTETDKRVEELRNLLSSPVDEDFMNEVKKEIEKDKQRVPEKV